MSWRGDKKNYNAYITMRNMDKLYEELIAWIMTKNRENSKKSTI